VGVTKDKADEMIKTIEDAEVTAIKEGMAV